MKKASSFEIGSSVEWKWLGRSIKGVIKEIHLKPVSKTIKEKVIKRNGTVENPAYLVQSEAGNEALKLQSELEISKAKPEKSIKPKMFG